MIAKLSFSTAKQKKTWKLHPPCTLQGSIFSDLSVVTKLYLCCIHLGLGAVKMWRVYSSCRVSGVEQVKVAGEGEGERKTEKERVLPSPFHFCPKKFNF